MSLRKDVPQLGPPLARLLDFLMDLVQVHVSENVSWAPLIAGAGGKRKRGGGRPKPPPRPRRRSGPSSPVTQLLEPVFVDPEVVGELVEDGGSNLVLQLPWVVPELLL